MSYQSFKIENYLMRLLQTMKFFALIPFILVSFVLVASAEEIKLVTVRDKNFDIVKLIDSQQEVDSFSALWNKKTVAPFGTRHWIYKIDMEPGDRWLYDPDGFTRVLTIKGSHEYKLADAHKFNEMLGIYNQTRDSDAAK